MSGYIKSTQEMQVEKHACCPPGSWPALDADYQPKGEKIYLDDVPVYHIGSGNRVIIIFTDIFGAFTGRHQNIADTYAEWGYNVYLPEILPQLYVGDPTDFTKLGPYITGLSQPKIKETFTKLVAYLEKEGYKRYFAVGFCWGVWKAVSLATEFQGIVSIVGFHPSIVVEALLGGVEAELVSKLKCPALFFPAGNDPANLKQGGQLIKILKEKHGEANSKTLSFPDMFHGWVVRGDLADPRVARDAESALRQSRQYLQKFQI